MEQSTTSRKKVLDDIQKKIAEIENQIQSDCKLLKCGNKTNDTKAIEKLGNNSMILEQKVYRDVFLSK